MAVMQPITIKTQEIPNRLILREFRNVIVDAVEYEHAGFIKNIISADKESVNPDE